MIINPMTYGVSALRTVLTEGAASSAAPSLVTSLVVMTLFASGVLLAGVYSVHAKRLA